MRRIAVVVLAGVLVVAAASPALAAGVQSNGKSLVVLSGDAYVPAGQTVESVVTFDGAVLVNGHVRGAVVAFNGPVTITGSIDGNVVVFDGVLTIASGARVSGNVFADRRTIAPTATVAGTVQPIARIAWGLSWASLIFGLAMWLAIALSVLALGLLLLWLAPRAAGATAQAGTTAVPAGIGWGFAVFVGLPVLAMIAIVTLVGIPLGLGVLLALALIFAIGQTVGVWTFGRAVAPNGSPLRSFVIGWAIASGVAVIPFVGGAVWLAATIYGLGALSVAAYRARRAPVEPATAPQVPPMPVSM